MIREIVFDTETTGLSPLAGDRVVEIGCIELMNHIPTGEIFHVYINPERDVPQSAFAVHGLSSAFLADKPVFAQVADDFLAFIGDAKLVAHNASFDLAFLNAELDRLGYPAIDSARIVDTLVLARKRNPFGSNSLDALCLRFGIDNSRRTRHGALLDSEILAEVYLELMGGRQSELTLARTDNTNGASLAPDPRMTGPRMRTSPLPVRLSPEDIAAHEAFVATLGSQPVWSDYRQIDRDAEA